MGKVLRPLLIITAVASAFLVPGIGWAVSAAVASGAVSLGGRRSGQPLGAFDPKSINMDPRTKRKFLFGQGLFFADLRYAEAYGTDQAMVDYIFVLAAHRSHAVDEIWIGDILAWTAGSGVTSDFSGYLTVEIILEAGAAAYHTAGSSGKWGAAQRLTGCTTAKLTVKRSANSKTSQSPFPGGLSGAVAFIGRGMPVYDPARDSTVPGGSGSQRANDCTTWAWSVGSVERGRNTALQQLAYRLGWRINGRRSVGLGMAPGRLNLAEYAAAAAICDESVTSATLGPVRRFESGLSGTDGDDPDQVIQALNTAMNGQVTNRGGQIGLRIAVNNLATPVLRLTDDDVIGGQSWTPAAPVSERFTVVRGEFTNPSGQTRFGPAAIPDLDIPRPSLVPRPLTYDLPAVQSQQQAQRIFKQVAQRNLVQGRFDGAFGIRARLLDRHDVIEFDFTPLGWAAELLTVEDIQRQADGSATLSLRRADGSVFAWDESDTAPVVPVVPVKFDSRKAASWLMAGIAPEADVTLDQPVVSRLDDHTGQAVDRRILPQIIGSGVIQLLDVNPLSASTDAGGVATITINAHVVNDDVGSLSMSSGSIGGLAASTEYYVWEANPNYQGGTRSYVATTNRNDLTVSGRRYVGFIITPAASGTSSGGGGGAGGGWPGGPDYHIP